MRHTERQMREHDANRRRGAMLHQRITRDHYAKYAAIARAYRLCVVKRQATFGTHEFFAFRYSGY